jgi:hypothetical protein
VIEGPAMGVEFYVPPGTPPDAVSISVPHVSHLFGSAKSGFRNLAHIGNSDACEVDLACDPTKAEIGKSVAKIIFTTDLGTFMCSGSLLADTDPTTTIPYFLTAYHCVENQSEAATIVFYWFFERAACGGPDPTAVTQTPGGATFLAGAIDTDFAFLRMNSAPPAGVVYAGWSTTPASPGEPVFGVHHPAGDLKKVSLGAVTAFSAWNAGPANTHIRMSWSSGVTEGGSSGSGLFRDGTYPNQFLIGLLTGGSSFCSAPADPDFYGRMDLFFTDVRSWLDPPPAVPTLVAPTGIVNTASPTFTWNASPNAAFYYLWVNGSAGTALQQWYTAAEAGCAAGTGTCSVTPAIILPAGPAAFWVAANNTGGTSAWSAQGDFTVVPGIPIAARVVALYEVPPLGAGGTARLWALIRNTGSQAMPAAARAWYFVDGPGWAGDHWVGFASVAGLASGAQIWVSFDWVVPGGAAPGSYWYSARVYAGGPISDWSLTKFFDVTAPALPTAQAVAPYPVNGGSIARLQNATLWGYVRNNGSVPLPAGTRVWMNVSGPGLSSSWVGSTLVQDLAPGAAQWYSVAWPIPGTITPGAYKYYLQVWVPSIGAISGASPSMNFTITP